MVAAVVARARLRVLIQQAARPRQAVHYQQAVRRQEEARRAAVVVVAVVVAAVACLAVELSVARVLS